MPRPGPRPYECVRRAWHSDKHQPIRGSLIQEIFRIANEVHMISTKKNKEWQEKLPVVVLRAEEIMYSRANSEAEYMDLKTLRDRTSDAINTIIRLDESTETGDFLQPCVEAALHLGCTPRSSSRSQQNSRPTCYLNQRYKTPSIFAGGLLETGNPIATPNWCFTPISSRSRAGESGVDCSKSQSIGLRSKILQNPEVDFFSPPNRRSSAFKDCESTAAPSEEDGGMSCREVECDLSLRLGSLCSNQNRKWEYLNSRSSEQNESCEAQTVLKRRKPFVLQKMDKHNEWWHSKVPRYESSSTDEIIRP